MNSVVTAPQPQRVLKPSEAFALLQEHSESHGQSREELSTRDWFGLLLMESHHQAGNALGLLIRQDCNKELLEAPAICQVPFTPSWLSGFTNVRGQITPVVEPYGFFQLSAPSPETQSRAARTAAHYVLYVEHEGDPFAIAVRHLPRKISVGNNQRMTQTPELTAELKSCIDASYHHEGIWCEWNLEKFKRRLTQMLSQN